MPSPDAVKQLSAGGNTYTLYFGNRAFRWIEISLGVALAKVDFSSLNQMTHVIWAGLLHHHPTISLDDVDGIIDEVGYEAIAEVTKNAIEAAFPDTETEQGNGNRAQRRSRQGSGTGTGS